MHAVYGVQRRTYRFAKGIPSHVTHGPETEGEFVALLGHKLIGQALAPLYVYAIAANVLHQCYDGNLTLPDCRDRTLLQRSINRNASITEYMALPCSCQDPGFRIMRYLSCSMIRALLSESCQISFGSEFCSAASA